MKFSSLGDVVLSTAAIRAIRQRFRENHKITVLVGEEAKDVLMRCPYIDELLVVDLKNKDKGLKGLLNLAGTLRKKNFDIVIDLQNNRISHLLSYLSACPKRYGYNNKKLGFLLNHRINDEKPPIDPVTHQFRVLKMLGIDLLDSHLEIWPSKEDELYIDDWLNTQWLSANQKLIGVHLSASKKWMTKSWPFEHIEKLCEELGYKDMRVVVTGTEENMPQAEALVNKVKSNKIINACAKTTINQLACLIKKCSCFVSADSSPLHIAAAVGVPFVALFGPTDPRRHVLPSGKYIVLDKELLCSPCYKPKCKTGKCMKEIKPEEVLWAVEKLLK